MENNKVDNVEVDIRKLNIKRSPKRGGSSDIDSIPYLEELNIKITDWIQPIQFNANSDKLIHGWAPYIQGFSASFVQNILDKYKDSYKKPYILDPFAGSGTVMVQSKLNGYESLGIEINPLMQSIGNTKLSTWGITSNELLSAYNIMDRKKRLSAPSFLQNSRHFKDFILSELECIKGGIYALENNDNIKKGIIDLLKVAFASILIDCSNLKRSPGLGYVKNKVIEPGMANQLFENKVYEIADDLDKIKLLFNDKINVPSYIVLDNSKTYDFDRKFDLVITSPPYMNGMDYAISYKIEMGWLDIVDSHSELKDLKDDMVVCDNVSKGLIKSFANNDDVYTNKWIEDIKENIQKNIEKRGKYRRMDMPYIVHKYFDDMYQVMSNVYSAMNKDGRFILVIGDSLIVDVYVPTDLILAKIGQELGFKIESIEKARERRSGQVRSYKLRETILTLVK